jgi:hypothetical protein
LYAWDCTSNYDGDHAQFVPALSDSARPPTIGGGSVKRSLLLALALLGTTAVGGFASARPAAALAGSCAGSSGNYISIVCDISSAKWTGVYAQWPSVPLNISQSWATQGRFIAEVTWLYNADTRTCSVCPWLEIGDTAGGGNIPGHINEWARMWYWVDGSTGSEIDHFYAYSASDSVVRAYGVQWNSVAGSWDICFHDACQFAGVAFGNPATFGTTTAAVGLELGSFGLGIDSNTNSGNFIVTNNKVRDPNGSWAIYPQAVPQVDAACGVAPSCLQGFWGTPVPPYTNWNNGKPVQ